MLAKVKIHHYQIKNKNWKYFYRNLLAAKSLVFSGLFPEKGMKGSMLADNIILTACLLTVSDEGVWRLSDERDVIA